MTQHLYPDTRGRESHLILSESPGEGQHPDKMQGHWVLARAGKRVLRPGGVRLTRQMLDALAIGPQDRVVEFAPGLGVTARMVLQKHPLAYWGVERDPAAAEHLRRQFAGTSTQIVRGQAEDSGLPEASASVVYGEALLSMQNPRQKNQIVAEACRLLRTGGRYGIHEICWMPDDIPDHVRHKIQAAISREIHVGVQPLCRSEWIRLLEQNGLKVTWSAEAPMHLLEDGMVWNIKGACSACFTCAARKGRRFFRLRRHRILSLSRNSLRRTRKSTACWVTMRRCSSSAVLTRTPPLSTVIVCPKARSFFSGRTSIRLKTHSSSAQKAL
jgi:SAM-dependent methyltransferase